METPEQIRSRNMAAIKNKNTKPELVLRKSLHARGYRYRLNVKQLPGSPDIVLNRYKAVIFINGCFWHKHSCHLFRWPQSRTEFWKNKILQNEHRDQKAISELKKHWRVCIVWECSIKGKTKLPLGEMTDMISNWLSTDSPFLEIPESSKVTLAR